MKRVMLAIGVTLYSLLFIVLLAGGGQTPVQEAMPNDAVQQVARERNMWESLLHFLLKSSWPRLVIVLGVAVVIVYLWKRPKKVKEECEEHDGE